MLEAIQAFDAQFLHFVQNALLSSQDFFGLITHLGNPALWLVVATVLYWNNREKNAFFLVNLLVFASAVAGVLKLAFLRSRPLPTEFHVDPENPLFQKFQGGIDYSFPSGHATTITTVVTYYCHQHKKTIFIALGILAVFLVALSRLVLGLHFLTDVIAGIVIGIVVGAVAWKTQKELQEHHFRLTKLKADAGLVLVLAVALVAMVFFSSTDLASILLGFYAGFFLGKETGLHQSRQSPTRKIAKTIMGFIVLGIILANGALYTAGLLSFALLFLGGFWVSFLYPWLFEKTGKKNVPKEKAIREYQKGKISLGTAAELAGVSLWEMMDELKARNIANPLGKEDYAEGLKNLKKIWK